MSSSNNLFAGLVGQENVKKKLGFYAKAFEATETCPFLFFVGAAGLGKTQFSKAFARSIKGPEGKLRNFIEINCSTIKNNEAFFTTVVPAILQNPSVCLFDEVHCLPKDVVNSMLSILNVNAGTWSSFTWDGQDFHFNFKRHVFLFATTESDQLFAPFRDRLTPVDFQTYSSDDLGQILKIYCPGIKFSDSALEKLASTTRGNARNAVMRAKEVGLYCKAERKKRFTDKDFNSYCSVLGILPLGITCSEHQLLSILKENGASSLSFLSAKTGLSTSAIRADHERYLLRRNLIQIDGKRKLTPQGRSVINQVETENLTH